MSLGGYLNEAFTRRREIGAINRQGELDRANIIKRAERRRQPKALFAATSGNPIDRLILETAKRYNIKPRTLDAVINAESSYNPRAVSKTGARGLGQLTPIALRDIGYTGSPDRLFDPATNLDLTAQYLNKIYDIRKPKDALEWYAAYSFGPYSKQPISDAYRSNFTRKYESSRYK